MRLKIANKLKKNKSLLCLSKNIYFLFEYIKRLLSMIISCSFLITPIKKNKIVVCNYFGKGYGDNGKYIINEILNQKLNYDVVWLLKKELINKSNFPDGIRIVEYGSIKGLYELATAKVWIDNCRKTFYPLKRKMQYYLQTWHGGIPLKKIEKDVGNKLSWHYVKIAKNDSKMANLFISNSEFCTNMYKKAFWYQKEILETGSPRCDILINEDNCTVEKIKKYYNINKGNKILLYAPTFRKNKTMSAYCINLNDLLKVLEEKTSYEWTILVRLHPNITNMSNFMEYSERIKNASHYDDMYELLLASDILITDYSSTMFEFSFQKKPVFLFSTDIEEYKKDRDFYFNIFKLPFPVSQSNEELYANIKQFDNKKYLLDLDSFLKVLNIFEKGVASKVVVDIIKGVIDSKGGGI